MVTINKDVGLVPAYSYTRQSNGTITSVKLTGNYYSLVTRGQHTDVVRRLIPADKWAAGTGWTYIKYGTLCHGIGLRTTGPTTWETALPSRWWTGSLTSRVSFPSDGLAGLLRSKIKAENVNLAQSLAEYHQTADLFSRAATDVYRFFRSLRSGRVIGDIARFVTSPRNQVERKVAKRWLQYQYGVKPLVSDVYGSCEALRQALVVGKYRYVTVRQRSRTVGSDYWPSGSAPADRHGQSSFSIEFQHTLRARYMIRDAGLKQLSQIGITNPVQLAWELIPYSFVIDWLIPVGDWLASLDALVGTSNFSYYDIKRISGKESGSTYGGSWESFYDSYARNGPLTTLSMPRLAYKPSTSLTKVLNGLALLRQLR